MTSSRIVVLISGCLLLTATSCVKGGAESTSKQDACHASLEKANHIAENDGEYLRQRVKARLHNPDSAHFGRTELRTAMAYSPCGDKERIVREFTLCGEVESSTRSASSTGMRKFYSVLPLDLDGNPIPNAAYTEIEGAGLVDRQFQEQYQLHCRKQQDQ